MKNINDRIRELIQQVTSDQRRYKELEELTGISAATWKTFWTRGSFPSAQMIEAIAEKFPQHAFWLACGITDPEHGHHSPKTFEVVDTWVPLDNKKLELRYRTRKRIRTAARDYFLTNIAIRKLPNWTEQGITEHEVIERQGELSSLLFQLDVEYEIRRQQEATLLRLEEEAIENLWDEEKKFRKWPKEKAKEIIEKQLKDEMSKDKYIPPKPDDTDIPF